MKVCFNGEMADEQDFVRSVSPFCESFQFGKAVFETLRTYDSDQVFALDEHLDRLMGSADILRLNLQSSTYNLQKGIFSTDLKGFVRSCTLQLVKENQLEHHRDLRIKIFLTETFFWVRTTMLDEMPDSFYREGVVVEETIFERNFPRVKYPNPAYHYLESIRSKEAWETICFSPDGYLREGSISNIFVVFGDKIVTPYEGILLGVTREKVLDTARQLDFKIEEREITRDEFLGADEIFLTCSTKEVVPVARIQSSNFNLQTSKKEVQKKILWENDNFEVVHKLREHFPRI